MSKTKKGHKEIHLRIDNEVYESIKQFMGLKEICGNLYGPEDEFVVCVIAFIEKGEKNVHIRKKQEEEPK